MNLPPDPDEMNNDRAEWAQAAVDAFERKAYLMPDTEEPQTVLADLLADLMHWCDRNEVDWQQALDSGMTHYDEETRDGN